MHGLLYLSSLSCKSRTPSYHQQQQDDFKRGIPSVRDGDDQLCGGLSRQHQGQESRATGRRGAVRVLRCSTLTLGSNMVTHQLENGAKYWQNVYRPSHFSSENCHLCNKGEGYNLQFH